MSLRKYIVRLFLFLVTSSVFSQGQESNNKNIKFKHISLNKGLSQSSVLCILQDSKGFLWFGTRDGLNKFDGNGFTIFRHNSQDTTSLSHSLIKTIYEDEKGDLWIGTIDGLNKYIPESNTFQRYYFTEEDVSGNNEIWSIVEADDTHLWIGTSSGLKKMNIKEGHFVPYNYTDTDALLFTNPTRALLKTNDNTLWIKTTENIGVYNTHTNTVKHYLYPENSPVELNKNNVSTLYQDKEKNIWLGFKNGLAILNTERDVFEFFRIKSKDENKIAVDVRSICEDYLGNLWVGTYKGLYIINPSKSAVSYFTHDENNPYSLSQNSIYNVTEDTKGDIWIGTYAGGVNYYDRNYDLFKHFSAGINDTKLNYKVVSSIIEDTNDNLWIGTEGGGINLYNKRKGRFKYITNSDSPSSLSTNNVKAMIKDHEGNFWIGTHDGGLNFLNPQKQPFAFKRYVNNPKDSNSISDNRVIALLEDNQNNIWIGTSGGGINILDYKTKSIARVQDSLEITGKIIYTISKTSDNDVLLIGGNKGLAKINIHTKKLSSIDYLGDNTTSHASRAVLCTYEDKDNNIWIGTEGGGLYHYNTTTMKAVNYGTSQGLPNNIVYGIVPDDDNNIWLSTNHGLSRINLQSFQIKNFNELDGLQSKEFNYGAYLKNKKGELLFGGTNGFNVFNPKAINENTFVPPVSITSIQVNNKPYLNITDAIEEVVLKHNQDVFNFDFVALSYSQPSKNQYAYKLEGFDADWNYIGNKTSATYTNLDDGTYLFKVKASNNDGLWNEKGDAIKVTILPAPWRTWWAYLIYTLIITGIILQIRKYSLLRIKERNELKQERLEKERIEEVNKMKLQLFTNVSHDFRTPLTLIIGPLERLLKMESKNAFVRKQHEIMYRNASTLMELINQLLDFRKNESGKLQLSASKNNIVPFVNNIKIAFDELANTKDINFTFSASSEDIKVWFDSTKLKKVIFNLLSNAFKFTPNNGEISLKITTYKDTAGKGYVKLKVKDNGKGIPKKNVKFIFDRFYQLGERSGTGIGLALTKSLVELHQGIINVKSKEKKGTSFTVLLPLGNAHLSKDQMVENDVNAVEDSLFNLEKSVYVDKEIIQLKEEALVNNNLFDASLASILIVEDNDEVRAFIKNIFLNTYNIFEAANGKNALEIAKTHDIDLIISDVMMPVMDGMELCNEIKTTINTSHIPVILLTAKTSKESQHSGYHLGADAYVTKPFDSNILEVRVANLLASRKRLIEKFKKDLILQPKEVTVTSADELFLKKAIDTVEQNLSNSEFTIAEFIDEMGMSRSVLYRKLKALTGQSISEFIRTIKLKRAAQLMKQTQMTISEIAFDLGFNDLKNFRKSFQKLFNVLPSEYRNTGSLQ
ncbi:hybrid sensor histidine kinase/response regulator transcription factor [Snuella sedimenti]|uniref:histidine kinase n=1 Tax=Snuella sedimenti TaxID=2798802 RepID=A0A8J7IW26_9FLAO|nr:two-component regulator propeller domain-containing protein [Snuella sedimenti]MBJ6368080.1 response regulator [Snuella sedimenti]